VLHWASNRAAQLCHCVAELHEDIWHWQLLRYLLAQRRLLLLLLQVSMAGLRQQQVLLLQRL
jgi:hypothetical protein